MRDNARRRLLVIGAAAAAGAILIAGAVSFRHAARPAAAPSRPAAAGVPARVAPVRHVVRRQASARAAAAIVSIELCAKAGTTTLPGGVSLPIWGYALKPAATPCTDASVTPSLPGPVLDVAEGSAVHVTVTNALAEDTSLELPQLPIAEGAVTVAPGGSRTYTFNAARPGTFLYQSGSGGRQLAMGLVGALVVRAATAGQAYDDAATAYATERVLVLTEVDPALNADPAGFDMEGWHPSYWLINGQAYPDTAHITAPAGSKLLLRYVNGGLDNHTMTMLGMHARLVGRDGFLLGNPLDVVSETIASGQTVDEIASVPASASGAHLALYNRQLHLSNGALAAPAHAPGGALTFVDVP